MNTTPPTAATIVLCGGPINYSDLPIGTTQSNAMIPVNGKPVIGWILDGLIARGVPQATVVLRAQNQRLTCFLLRAYSPRMGIELAALEQDGTIVQSLQAGLAASPRGVPVQIILGDTLINDSLELNRDFVCVGEVEETSRWCIVRVDERGSVVEYIDKRQLPEGRHAAIAGHYHLLDGDYLRDCVKECVDEGDRELSAVLGRYSRRHPIHATVVREWYDFGHIDNLVRAKHRLLQPRYFNALTVDPVLGTITKVSSHDEKLQDELFWYLSLPQELKVLTPRIVSHQAVNGSLEIVQEYYGYPTLAELFVYGDVTVDTWKSILRRVLRVHQQFRKYPSEIPLDDVTGMYVGKTLERLGALAARDAGWAARLEADTVWFNGIELRNMPVLLEPLRQAVARLAPTTAGSIIHGDLCFSNILFDVNSQIIRLIDPRGRFGRQTIYGDPRYDIAKLRHSARGLYDFIVADMFELHEAAGKTIGKVFTDGTPEAIGDIVDELLREAGYEIRDIALIEGLLFLSMLPLHHDHPRRQQMMYFAGLSLLNDVL